METNYKMNNNQGKNMKKFNMKIKKQMKNL